MAQETYSASAAKVRLGYDASRIAIAPWIAALALVLLFTAYLLSAAFRTPPPWSLQIGALGDTRFSSGFFLPELSGAAAFRWSGPGARLVLHGADGVPLALAMRLNGDQVLQSGDPRFSLVPEQQGSSAPLSTTFALTSGWRNYHVLLPPSDNGVFQPPAYTLDSATHRPGPNDGRDLGAAVGTVRLLPITSDSRSWLLAGWPLHPRALFLVWGLAVVFFGLEKTRRETRDARRATIVTLLAMGIIVVLAVALVVWARFSPYTLAATLPPMPWTFGLLSVALVAGPVVKGLTRWLKAGEDARGETRDRSPTTDNHSSLITHHSSLSARRRWMLWCGMGLLVVAQVLLNAQTLVWLGGALALLALAMVVAADSWETRDARRETRDAIQQREFSSHPSSFILHPSSLVSLMFLLAFVLRFYDLGGLPYGLWRDEARHGLVALRILQDPDYRPVYIAEGGVNMPALIFYPFALALKLWGIHPWTMRPVTALAGALTVLPLYGLVRRLFGVRAALLAALLLAISAWHITISRFSFPTIFDPLFGLTGLWLLMGIGGWGLGVGAEKVENQSAVGSGQLLLKTQHSKSKIQNFFRLLLAGICFGLAIQTYHTGRVVPIVAGVLSLGILWEQVTKRRKMKDEGRKTEEGNAEPSRASRLLSPVSRLLSRWLLSLLIVALGFLLVATPMLLYALRQEAAFNDRVGGVFLLSDDALQGVAPLAALDDTLGRHLLMFNVRGDSNGRHAPPNRPALDFVTGLGLLLGCALLLRWRASGTVFGRDWRGLFLFAALALSLLPSALAVDAPHGMRGIGAASFACVIAALGLEWAWRLLTDERRETREESKTAGIVTDAHRPAFVSRLSSFVPIVVLLLAALLNIYTYFIWMRASPEVWVAFYPVHTQVGAYVRDLREHGDERQIFVAAGIATNPVFVYLTSGYDVQTFDAGVASEPLRSGAIFILSGYTYTKDSATLASYLGPNPQPLVVGPDFPDGRSPSFVAYPVAQNAASIRR